MPPYMTCPMMSAIWPYLVALMVGVVVIAAFPAISTIAV